MKYSYHLAIETYDELGKWVSSDCTNISRAQYEDIIHIAITTEDTYIPIDWDKLDVREGDKSK